MNVEACRLPATRYAIINAIAVQATWFCAVIGGAAGLWWPGVLAAGITVLGHLAVRRDWRREALRVGAAGLLGALVDTALIQAGFITILGGFGGANNATSIWMIALWLSFATSLSAGLKMLQRLRWWLVAIIGAVAGVVSYAGGAKLGALTFPPGAFTQGTWSALAAVATAWAMALPLLVAMTRNRGDHD